MRFDFLEESDRRILLGLCASSILNRKNTNTELEGMMEPGMMDSLIYDVLLFIMDASLSLQEGCLMREIVSFVKEDLKEYGKDIDSERLSEYIVKDILQNKGVPLYFDLFNHETGQVKQVTVRLVESRISDENELIYHLSSQGYDFLLRTREVDMEFEGWVNMLIVQQQLQKGNYKDSYAGLRRAGNILRQESEAFDEFLLRVRQDLSGVQNDEYSKLIDNFYQRLEEEKDISEETEKLVESCRLKILEENPLLSGNEKAEEALHHLADMAALLKQMITKETELLQRRFEVREIYSEMLDANLSVSAITRYDFYQEVIDPISKLSSIDEAYAFTRLISPLFKPRCSKIFDLHLIYGPEDRLRETDNTPVLVYEDSEEDEEEKEIVSEAKACYRMAFDALLAMAEKKKDFSVKEFLPVFLEEENSWKCFTEKDKYFLHLMMGLFAKGKAAFPHVFENVSHRRNSTVDFDPDDLVNDFAEKGKLRGLPGIYVYRDEEEKDDEIFLYDEEGMRTGRSEGLNALRIRVMEG